MRSTAICIGGLVAACSSAPGMHDAPSADAPLPTALPASLQDVGLYSDFANKVVADGTVQFAPRNVLWSDGAVKTRWIQLPAGATIDSSDMDHWVFPLGTKLIKEFALDGLRLETRVIWRVADTGDFQTDTLVGAYVWNDDESDATFMPDGEDNIRGTPHDAPSADTCWKCHVGDAGHVLGFSALQLPDLSNVPLSEPPPAGAVYGAPTPELGYLHVNCGHCHNPNGSAWVDSHMVLRLGVDEHDVTTSQIYQTTVGVELEQWIDRGYTYRIVAGDPDASAIAYRMAQRGTAAQMPPIATEFVDDTGLASIRAWIQSLSN